MAGKELLGYGDLTNHKDFKYTAVVIDFTTKDMSCEVHFNYDDQIYYHELKGRSLKDLELQWADKYVSVFNESTIAY